MKTVGRERCGERCGRDRSLPEPGDLSTHAQTQTQIQYAQHTLTLRSRQTLQERDWRFGALLGRESGAESRSRGSRIMMGLEGRRREEARARASWTNSAAGF